MLPSTLQPTAPSSLAALVGQVPPAVSPYPCYTIVNDICIYIYKCVCTFVYTFVLVFTNVCSSSVPM